MEPRVNRRCRVYRFTQGVDDVPKPYLLPMEMGAGQDDLANRLTFSREEMMHSKKFLIPLMVAVALLAVLWAVSVAQPAFGSSPTPSVWLARNAGSNHETIAFDSA